MMYGAECKRHERKHDNMKETERKRWSKTNIGSINDKWRMEMVEEMKEESLWWWKRVGHAT